MVFGILFMLFAIMHDIKLWTYIVPGDDPFPELACFAHSSCP